MSLLVDTSCFPYPENSGNGQEVFGYVLDTWNPLDVLDYEEAQRLQRLHGGNIDRMMVQDSYGLPCFVRA